MKTSNYCIGKMIEISLRVRFFTSKLSRALCKIKGEGVMGKLNNK